MHSTTYVDYWADSSPSHPHRNGAHPLALFDPAECGAWVATLRALRAMPDSTLHPPPPRKSGPDGD